MRGWNANKNTSFDFQDAHDLDTMTGAAQNEQYVKSKLRQRVLRASAVLVLIGENTRWLYKYVRWELELALELGLPIVAVSLAGGVTVDPNLMPPIIRNACIVEVPFKAKAVKYALDHWPQEFQSLSSSEIARGPRFYGNSAWE
jgi:hypothetical protein